MLFVFIIISDPPYRVLEVDWAGQVEPAFGHIRLESKDDQSSLAWENSKGVGETSRALVSRTRPSGVPSVHGTS